MGWSYTNARSREQITAEVTAGWSNDDATCECLAHETVGGILWAVFEYRKENEQPVRYILCRLFDGGNGRGCGWKDLTDEMHPYYYSCPVEFLDMSPARSACSEEWRKGVRQFAAGQPVHVKTAFDTVSA
jgi:hypothetical protein